MVPLATTAPPLFLSLRPRSPKRAMMELSPFLSFFLSLTSSWWGTEQMCCFQLLHPCYYCRPPPRLSFFSSFLLSFLLAFSYPMMTMHITNVLSVMLSLLLPFPSFFPSFFPFFFLLPHDDDAHSKRVALPLSHVEPTAPLSFFLSFFLPPFSYLMMTMHIANVF